MCRQYDHDRVHSSIVAVQMRILAYYLYLCVYSSNLGLFLKMNGLKSNIVKGNALPDYTSRVRE